MSVIGSRAFVALYGITVANLTCNILEHISRVSWLGASWHARGLLEGRSQTLEHMCNMQSVEMRWTQRPHQYSDFEGVLLDCPIDALPYRVLAGPAFHNVSQQVSGEQEGQSLPNNCPNKDDGDA